MNTIFLYNVAKYIHNMDANGNPKFPNNNTANEVCDSGLRERMHKFLRAGTALTLQDVENSPHIPMQDHPGGPQAAPQVRPPNADNEPER